MEETAYRFDGMFKRLIDEVARQCSEAALQRFEYNTFLFDLLQHKSAFLIIVC
jgi:hypothetical protein